MKNSYLKLWGLSDEDKKLSEDEDEVDDNEDNDTEQDESSENDSEPEIDDNNEEDIVGDFTENMEREADDHHIAPKAQRLERICCVAHTMQLPINRCVNKKKRIKMLRANSPEDKK